MGANGWWAGPDKVATCDCERNSAIWKFGLQMRLVLGFAAILALSTGAVALYTGFAAHHEGAHLQSEQDRVRAHRVTVALADFYRSSGGWDGVQNFIDRISYQVEREIVALDAAGNVVGDSRNARHWRGGQRCADRGRARRLRGGCGPGATALPPCPGIGWGSDHSGAKPRTWRPVQQGSGEGER